MDLEKLNRSVEKNNFYQFIQKHKRVLNVINGIFIIGLLIGINTYMVKDYAIKKQIAEHCGYTTNKYVCVCEKNYVDNWKEVERGFVPEELLNFSYDDDSLDK